MAPRAFSPIMRAVMSNPSASFRATRSFQTSSRRLADTVPLPVRKPVGAFRGGLFGFLLGSTLAGAGVYYYILEEYKSLQGSVQRVHTYVQTLEEKLAELEKKKKLSMGCYTKENHGHAIE